MSRTEAGPLFGDMACLTEVTGWSHDRISRLCRRKLIPGAFRVPGSTGKNVPWCFEKKKVMAWINGLSGKL